MLITVGRIMMPRMTEAASTDKPAPPKCARMNGASTITPMKPYTTDGIPASNSIVGLMTRVTGRGTNSIRNTAAAIPSGAPMTIAPQVTHSDATIIG